jgi:hypothetical protein
VEEWHPLFGDALLASAAMDRLLHGAHVVILDATPHVGAVITHEQQWPAAAILRDQWMLRGRSNLKVRPAQESC